MNLSALVSEATIQLAQPARLVTVVCEHLAEHDLEVTLQPGLGRVGLGDRGWVEMRAADKHLSVRIEAADADALAWARGAVAEHLAEFAEGERYTLVWTGHGAGDRTLHNFRVMRVLRTAQVTPHMRRVTLAGEDIGRFETAGGLHCKLMFPPKGLAEPEWPTMGEDGRLAWPPVERRPAVRIYTIRRIDVASGEMDVDFVIHGDGGIGSGWAETAATGDPVGVLGPGGGDAGPADWYLLAGDETALPAIGRILEHLPETARGVALIEVAGEEEQQQLRHPSGVALRWLHRDGAEPGTTTLLRDAVLAVEWPAVGERVFAWAGCEFATFKAIRAHWRGERGLTRDQHLAVAYWRRGRVGD